MSGREAQDRKAGFCSLARLVRLARSKVSPWAWPPSGAGASSRGRLCPRAPPGQQQGLHGSGGSGSEDEAVAWAPEQTCCAVVCPWCGHEKPEWGCDGGRPGTQERRSARSGRTPGKPRRGGAARTPERAGRGRSGFTPGKPRQGRAVCTLEKAGQGRSGPHPRESQAGPERSPPRGNLDGAGLVPTPEKAGSLGQGGVVHAPKRTEWGWSDPHPSPWGDVTYSGPSLGSCSPELQDIAPCGPST